MYTPVLNAKEKARELIDIMRQQTDTPIDVCIETVSFMLGALLADLPAEEALRSVRNALFEDDLIDINNCYDAKIMQKLITELTDNIEDKEQQSWTLKDDEEALIESLHQLASILLI
uniref:SPIN90/Ldb17 leucine-rich domain-containing protein n=1 Tax=Parascaris univalens TaxID=6257 RepID=A0A915AVM6_PARUN